MDDPIGGQLLIQFLLILVNAFFAATGADIRTSDEPQAYYNPAEDFIHMPPIATFHSAAGYYATLAHEACHATGHTSRLDRLGRFTDRKAYEAAYPEIGKAFRELIGSFNAAMTAVEVAGLIEDRAKVEIEVTAVVPD